MSRCRIRYADGGASTHAVENRRICACESPCGWPRSPDELAAADHLAEVTKIPRRYLHKVVQDLVRAAACSLPAGAWRRLFHRSVTQKDHDSGRRQCCRAVGADSPLPTRSGVPHATLPAASRARQGLRRDGKSIRAGDAGSVTSFHQRDRSIVRGEVIAIAWRSGSRSLMLMSCATRSRWLTWRGVTCRERWGTGRWGSRWCTFPRGQHAG